MVEVSNHENEVTARPPLQGRLLIVSHKRHIRGHGTFAVKGGFQRLTDEIARHFRDVTLCVPVEDGSVLGAPYRANIKVVPLPPLSDRLSVLRNLSSVVSIIAEEVKQADLVYCMGPNDIGIIGMTVSRLIGAPLFASLDTDRARNVMHRDYRFHKKMIKYLVNRLIIYQYIKLMCRRIPVFVTGNMFMGSYPLWEQWVKNTVRTSDMPSYIKPSTTLDGPHVVFAGRLAPQKNVQKLIEALAIIRKFDGGVRGTIIGSGELKVDLSRYASTINAPVRFVGDVSNEYLIDSRFMDADVLVLPSLEERQGKVILEAMACSVPVVASNVGGIGTVVENEVNGVLCDPTDVNDIADKIWKTLRNYELRCRIVRNGYHYAQHHALDIEVNRIIGSVRHHYQLA